MKSRTEGFYRDWILANAGAEAVGLGTTFVLGTALAPYLDREPSVSVLVGGAFLAIVMGMLLEGVVVGFAQSSVLGRVRPDVAGRRWVAATTIGAGIAWSIGMIPSTVMSLAAAGAPAPTPAPEPGPALQLVLAAGMGLVTGPVLGLAQWVVLRRSASRAGAWLWANAAAWALGMPAIFLGMDLVPWQGTFLPRATAIYAVCFVAGAIAGAVHGPVLRRIAVSEP